MGSGKTLGLRAVILAFGIRRADTDRLDPPAQAVLDARAGFSEATLADLYDRPDAAGPPPRPPGVRSRR